MIKTLAGDERPSATAGKSAYTPGPWKILTDDQGSVFFVRSSDNKIVAFIKHANLANARLIAAAPELLETCKALCDLIFYVGSKVIIPEQYENQAQGRLESAVAAIAKAEGK